MPLSNSSFRSVSLSALFYHLLRNPSSYRRLQEEIDRAFQGAGETATSTDSCISMSTAQSLPYLSAVIKEAFRMHPAVAWAPERVVPPSGHVVCGQHLPGGTVVGVSAWMLHRDPTVFGDDADTFRPERWLEDEGEAREMEKNLLHFGAGAYSCLGRNIALMEMYVAVPALLRRFEVRLFTCSDRLFVFADINPQCGSSCLWIHRRSGSFSQVASST